MTSADRENALSAAFVELADTLVGDFDVADVMQSLVEHSVTLLDVDAAGLLLKDQRGDLHLMASSSEATRLLELFQLQVDEGPCLECVRTGQPVSIPNLNNAAQRWPRFAPAALSSRLQAVYAVPLRLRDNILGALNMFTAAPREMPEADQKVARALADVASIGILQARAIQHAGVVMEQLEGALISRVTIEQAKGILADRGALDMDQAFQQLRLYSRSTNSRLTDVATALVEGRIAPAALLQQHATTAAPKAP